MILAGNIPDTADNFTYYKTEIEPQIDNKQIIYTGPLNDVQKNEYLGQAKALLFPIEWDEPFGMVMIEAMACGTPVIAFKKGSVPEVVENGTTGFIVNNAAEMGQKVSEVSNIDRGLCRSTAGGRFDVKVIARQYLSLFDAR